MNRAHALAAVVAAVVAMAVACGSSAHERVAAPPFLTDRNGGPTTARALRGRPFNQSARNLDNAGLARFAAGAEPFDQFFTTGDGLGPDHDRSGCLSCHLDGTEAPDVPSDAVPPGLIVRISLPGGDGRGVRSGAAPVEVPGFGLQLTPETTAEGASPEATVDVGWKQVVHRTADGRKVRLRRPVLEVRASRSALPADIELSPRMAQTMIGLGLLEAIPESSLESVAALQAGGRSGVSGEVQRVVDAETGRTVVGRFGWKASQPTVAGQTLAALHHDLGITTPEQTGGVVEADGDAGTVGAEPEMDQETLDDLVFYNRTIAVPISRASISSARARRGATAFERIGCGACHMPTQVSGPDGGPDRIAALADVEFHPYTDLLLHDMGPGLADGRPEFEASGREWRTAPLWGLSRRVEVTGVRAFLHDGRARTPEEAILWHDGEARRARLRFERLSPSERAELLAFLASL